MPKFLAIGVSYERFMDSNPNELKPFVEAERLEMIRRDEDMYVMGIYVQKAVAVAVEGCLAGRKAKGKYFDKPLRADIEESVKEEKLSEAELKRQREMFMTKLMLMKVNFDLNKNKAENDRA